MIRFSQEQFDSHQARVKGVPRSTAPAPKQKHEPKKESPLEVEFLRQLNASGLPPMVREHKPFKDRKFRMDFAYPDRKLAVECEGRVHRIKERWLAFHERHALLSISGWVVLYVCREQILEGEAIRWLKELMEDKS